MATAPTARDVLRDRSVDALLLSVLASTMAVVCQATALGKQVFDLTGRELDLGLLGLAEFLPAALLVIVTGHVADRFDRRRVAAIGLTGELACAVGLAWYASTNPTSVLPIYLFVIAFGVARAFVAPATRALPPDVVGSLALPRLIALNSAAWQAGMIVGPVMAGFLYAGQPWWPYILTCALLLVSIASILVVRVDHAEPQHRTNERPTLHEALEGLRVIRQNPVLLGAISLDLFAVLFGGAVALLPAIAEDQLGVGAVGLGWLRAATGIGAAVMTLILAARPLGRHVGRTLLAVVAAFGVFTIVLGVTHSFAIAFLSLLALSAADAVSVFIRATLVPLITPPASRGRVMAVENVFIGASNELGAFESGVAAQLLGIAPAVVLGGIATMGIAGAWWFLFPGLRDVDRFSDLSRHEPARSTQAATGHPAPEQHAVGASADAPPEARLPAPEAGAP